MSIELLERGKQPIKLDSPDRRIQRLLTGWVEAIKRLFDESTWHRPEFKFYEYAIGTDYWWYTFDPQTGYCIYADSKAELLLLTKENYAGQ